MENLAKGWKTIVFFILTAALAGVDSLTDYIEIPNWYFMYITPGVGVFLRWLTTGTMGLRKWVEGEK